MIQRMLAQRVPIQAMGMAQVSQKLAHYTMRSGLPINRLWRIKPIWQALQNGCYHRYADDSSDWYSPYLAVLGDLLE